MQLQYAEVISWLCNINAVQWRRSSWSSCYLLWRFMDCCLSKDSWWDSSIPDLMKGYECCQPTWEFKYYFHWDSRNCKSDVWQHFHEVAEYPSDAPKTQCQLCKSICTHPLPKQHDTNTLSKHLLWNKCNSPLNAKQSRMSSIMESFTTRRIS